MEFTYVEAEEVKPLIKGGLNANTEDMLRRKLVMLSSQLSGRFPGLRKIFQEEERRVVDGVEEYSDLVDLVRAMVTESARRFIANPDGMSSETIGVFAYSRFDSSDPLKEAFDAKDLQALGNMIEAIRDGQVGSFHLKSSYNMYPAAPMPTPFTYSNSRNANSWRR